jgi:hypothetical protein
MEIGEEQETITVPDELPVRRREEQPVEERPLVPA